MYRMITPPAALEALLFAKGESISKKSASALLEISIEQLAIVCKVLRQSLIKSGLALIETDTDIELRTARDATDIVEKLHKSEVSNDLGKASLETLAVIAYQKDPTRGEIDWVRGVNSSTSLRTLLMRGLIEGKEDSQDKRRIRYALTTEALAHLGIDHINELPRAKELQSYTQEIIKERSAQKADTLTP